jgi:hypothetical protein
MRQGTPFCVFNKGYKEGESKGTYYFGAIVSQSGRVETQRVRKGVRKSQGYKLKDVKIYQFYLLLIPIFLDCA